MMSTIYLNREQIHKGNLILVNESHPLSSFCDNDLYPVDMRFSRILIKREAANALHYVLKKISCDSEIIPVSGYRSASEQAGIYADALRDHGEQFTKSFVALPNRSEHQTGLAIDLGLNSDVIDFICPSFPYEGICNAFRLAAPHYGFIERYPEKKEKITGIAHEPWHFRYIGYPHSQIMSDNEWTLEEYTELIRNYTYEKKHLYLKKHERITEVFFVPADDEEETEIALPEQTIYQVSGNNVDGFIVTLWRNNSELQENIYRH